MRARIDISEVEARTKIRAKYLRALENEEWDLLPGSVYVKSFLRAYGDFLGLDSRLLIDEFRRRYEHPDEHELRSPSVRARERERERSSRRMPNRTLSPVAVIIAALVVIVGALYVIGSNSPSGQQNAGTPPPTLGGGSSTTAQHHGRTKRTGTGTSTSSTTTGTGTTTGSTTGTTTGTSTTQQATLQLAATALIWVCVEGPAHKLIVPGIEYQAGQTVTASGPALWVSLGNRNATLTVNGKVYVPTSTTDPIGLKITAAGATPISSPPLCRG